MIELLSASTLTLASANFDLTTMRNQYLNTEWHPLAQPIQDNPTPELDANVSGFQCLSLSCNRRFLTASAVAWHLRRSATTGNNVTLPLSALAVASECPSLPESVHRQMDHCTTLADLAPQKCCQAQRGFLLVPQSFVRGSPLPACWQQYFTQPERMHIYRINTCSAPVAHCIATPVAEPDCKLRHQRWR